MTDKSFDEWAAEYHRESEKIKNQIEALRAGKKDAATESQIQMLYYMYLDLVHNENELKKYIRKCPIL